VNLLRRDKTALKTQLIRRSAFNLARLLGTLRPLFAASKRKRNSTARAFWHNPELAEQGK
jgi:hypothetical protein|tara:strand:+ start:602 stop:781 length:180 start_codon:yes stop_codon:yes gene_type:complete